MDDKSSPSPGTVNAANIAAAVILFVGSVGGLLIAEDFKSAAIAVLVVVGAAVAAWVAVASLRLGVNSGIAGTAENLDRDGAIASVEARTAPRVLSADKQARIAEKLRPWGQPGCAQMVAIFPLPLSGESVILAGHLTEAFKSAGWAVVSDRFTYGAKVDGLIGVGVLFSSDAQSAEIVNVLLRALHEEGLVVEPMALPHSELAGPRITVVVGAHP